MDRETPRSKNYKPRHSKGPGALAKLAMAVLIPFALAFS